MKKQYVPVSIFTMLLLVFSLLTSALAVDTISIDEQIEQTKVAIASLKEQISAVDDGVTAVIGTTVTTIPNVIVQGYGVGANTVLSSTPYFLIEDPVNGTSYFGYYCGTHKYIGTKTLTFSDGGKFTVNVMGAMPDKWRELDKALDAAQAKLKKLEAERPGDSSTSVSNIDLQQYALNKNTDIVLQVGNPNMYQYGVLYRVDENESVPTIIDGSTYLPIRGLIQGLSGTVTWDDTTRSVTVSLNGSTVIVTLDSTTATVNGKTVTLSTPPKLVNSKTMLPLRFIVSNLGMGVDWYSETQVIVLHYSQYWWTHLEAYLTTSDSNFYTLNDQTIGGAYDYPKAWGLPGFEGDDTGDITKDYTTTYNNGDINVLAELYMNGQFQDYNADEYMNNFGGTELPLTTANTGIVKILVKDTTDGGAAFVLCDNERIILFSWSIVDENVDVASTKNQVIEVLNSISVYGAAG